MLLNGVPRSFRCCRSLAQAAAQALTIDLGPEGVQDLKQRSKELQVLQLGALDYTVVQVGQTGIHEHVAYCAEEVHVLLAQRPRPRLVRFPAHLLGREPGLQQHAPRHGVGLQVDQAGGGHRGRRGIAEASALQDHVASPALQTRGMAAQHHIHPRALRLSIKYEPRCCP